MHSDSDSSDDENIAQLNRELKRLESFELDCDTTISSLTRQYNTQHLPVSKARLTPEEQCKIYYDQMMDYFAELMNEKKQRALEQEEHEKRLQQERQKYKTKILRSKQEEKRKILEKTLEIECLSKNLHELENLLETASSKIQNLSKDEKTNQLLEPKKIVTMEDYEIMQLGFNDKDHLKKVAALYTNHAAKTTILKKQAELGFFKKHAKQVADEEISTTFVLEQQVADLKAQLETEKAVNAKLSQQVKQLNSSVHPTHYTAENIANILYRRAQLKSIVEEKKNTLKSSLDEEEKVKKQIREQRNQRRAARKAGRNKE